MIDAKNKKLINKGEINMKLKQETIIKQFIKEVKELWDKDHSAKANIEINCGFLRCIDTCLLSDIEIDKKIAEHGVCLHISSDDDDKEMTIYDVELEREEDPVYGIVSYKMFNLIGESVIFSFI